MKKSKKALSLILTLIMALSVFLPVAAECAFAAEETEDNEIKYITIYDLEAPPAGALGTPIIGYKIKTVPENASVIVVDSYWGHGLGYGDYHDVRTIAGRTYFAYFAIKGDNGYVVTKNTNLIINNDWGRYGDFWSYRYNGSTISAMTEEKFTVTKGTYDGTQAWKPDKAFASIEASAKEFVYDGKAKLPSFTIKDGERILEEGKDYYVTIADASGKEIKEAIELGNYTAIVNGYGDYIGTESRVEFAIKAKLTEQPPADKAPESPATAPSTPSADTEAPVKVSVPKITLSAVKSKKSKQITVSWKKNTKVNGYEIQYTTDKKFKKSVKKVTVKKNKTTSTTIKKLKAKKKYYVRIRAYKTVDGKKYYSAWSKSKAVTTKK